MKNLESILDGLLLLLLALLVRLYTTQQDAIVELATSEDPRMYLQPMVRDCYPYVYQLDVTSRLKT